MGERSDPTPVRRVLRDAQQLVSPDDRSAVQPVVAVANDAGVTDRHEREEALGAPHHAAELVDGVVGVAPLECPDHPRVERVVAGPVGDVRDAREELAVEGDAGRLHAEVV
ncbi:MAG: hypothetical protein AB7H96_13650 [Vicinamibacterales bacterium]